MSRLSSSRKEGSSKADECDTPERPHRRRLIKILHNLQVLTTEERQTFSNLISSNRAAEFVPLWKPWWHEKAGLIEEVRP